MPDQRDVFISYSRANTAFARHLIWDKFIAQLKAPYTPPSLARSPVRL